MLNQNFSVAGVEVTNPTGNISIGGTHTLSIGTYGIDLSAATRNLTLTAPVILSEAQTWRVASGRTLAVNGGVSGSRNLSLGVGIISIGNNHLNTTYSGVLSGSGSLVKIGNGTLTLSGANSYNGGTTVNGGTLTLGASNSFLGNVTIGSATLDAATFTDTIGTLDITSAARIHLGAGGRLAFASSGGVDWTGGTLTVTGPFATGSSLRFGNSAGGISTGQLAQISITGFRNIGINSSGYLTATIDPVFAYNNWSGGAAFDADTNRDGIANGIAWVVGAASPSASATGLLPTFDTTTDPAYFTYTYRRTDTANAAIGNTIAVQYGMTPGAWTTAIHDGTNIIITVTNDIAPGLDSVQVKLKRTLAPGGTLFARLRVQITP